MPDGFLIANSDSASVVRNEFSQRRKANLSHKKKQVYDRISQDNVSKLSKNAVTFRERENRERVVYEGSFKSSILDFMIPAQDSCIYYICFQPYQLREYDANMVITSDDYDEGVITIPLIGEGVHLDVKSNPIGNEISNIFDSDTLLVCPLIKIFDDVIVDSTICLTISPYVDSVNVSFMGNYGFTVYGDLVSDGTESKSVYYNVADSVDYWTGIKFSNNSEGESFIQFSEFHNAYNTTATGFGGALTFTDYDGNNRVSNSIFRDNETQNEGGVFQINDSDIIIDSCYISRNTSLINGGAIFCETADVTISNSFIDILALLDYTHKSVIIV
jgi:hypothetical protein